MASTADPTKEDPELDYFMNQIQIAKQTFGADDQPTGTAGTVDTRTPEDLQLANDLQSLLNGQFTQPEIPTDDKSEWQFDPATGEMVKI